MADIHQVATTQNCNKKPCVSLYWDWQNVKLSANEVELLLKVVKEKRRLLAKKVYYNSLCKDQASTKDALAKLGFNCLDVPCTLKDSADNRLKSDCLDDIYSNVSPDIVVIVSGDGDFLSIVKNLQALGKKIIIFAKTGNIKQKLKDIADEFYFVEDLPDLVAKKHQQQKDSTKQEVEQLPDLVEVKPQTQTNSGKPKIPYQDAIKWLFQAIQTAANEGKGTKLSQVDKLMRNMPGFPKCEKFPVVCKSDGKTFSSFGKFVTAVVAEGKIKKHNQELLLIEQSQKAI